MDIDINKSFIMAKRLHTLRKNKGLSHEGLSTALSEKYGIKISSDSLMNYEVSREEHTKKYKNLGMRVEYLYCFADFYGVSTDYLLGLVDNPTPNQSIQAVCQYTGLSPETAELLHAYKASGFINQLIDAILCADGIPDDMPEALNDSAQAQIVSLTSKVSYRPDIEREVNNRIATITRNGKNEYYISAEHAADLYLSKAIAIATENISAVVREMRDTLAITLIAPQNPDAIEFEFIVMDENDIPPK